MKTLGTYTITYGNGYSQKKNLIEHSDYTGVIKPTHKEIFELEMELDKVGKKKKKEIKAQIKELKNKLLDLFGENWFTNQSPIFNAIKTEVLSLPKQQGGDHYCKVSLS